MSDLKLCADAHEGSETRAGWKRLIGPVIGVLALILGATLLYRTIAAYEWAQIVEAVAAIPVRSILGSIAFAALSYFCLSWFDWLALRYVGHPQPYRRALLASFTSLSIGHNIGFAGLSSGAIRYRFYQRWGLGLADVAKLVVFCGLTVALGLATVAGLALVISPDLAARLLRLDITVVVAVGSTLLALVVCYLGLSIFVSKPLGIGRWKLEIPSTRLAAAQVAVGSLNFLCVSACLHQMISASGDIGYFEVAAAYVISNIAAILSHVPGGVGVIETILTILLPGMELIGVLIAFRVIYYLLPLAIGLPLFGLSELFLTDKRP